MSKDFLVLHNGRVVYRPGHYERSDAEAIAQNAARRFPGRTYTVVHILAKFQLPRKRVNATK